MNNPNIEIEEDFLNMNSPSQIFQKLDCMVTLGYSELDEDENLFQNIQVEQPEIKKFQLQRFFDDYPEPQQFAQKHSENFHEPKMRPPRKMSMNQNLPSFIEEVDATISNIIEKQANFHEQAKYIEALNNIDNFTFMEQNLETPQVFKQFQSQYLRIIQKLRSYQEQKRLDLRQFMAFVCSLGVEFIQEIFNLICKADIQFVFGLLQQQGLIKQSSELQQQHTQQKQQKQVQQQEQQFQQQQKIESYPYSTMSVTGNESVNQEKKGNRKIWTHQEEILLQNFLNQNGSITNQQIQDISNQLGRTWYSVQSKLQKMKRNVQENLSDVKSMSIKIEQSKEIKEAKEVKEQKLQRCSSKYEYTVEEMIKFALQSLEKKQGTKQQIIETIRTNYIGRVQDEQTCIKSISITLSNNKNQFIQKVKGYYTLNEGIQDKVEDDNKLKNKLIWIIQNLPGQKGTLDQIVNIYTNEMILDELGLKKISKQISQILRSSNRFDKRHSKTIYKMIE